ncbi:MAG: hypothetical protein QM790_20790 [Nibricoccus sp.]
MDNLYTLLRAVDNSYALPLSRRDATSILTRKKAYFLEEAKTNPIVREILNNGCVACDEVDKTGHRSFLNGAPTFFRVHELLRCTRRKNLPLQVGAKEVSHNEAVELYERCVPNVRLYHAPWCSLARYSTSLGLAWTSTALVAHFVARSWDSDTLLDPEVVYRMGLVTTVLALGYTAFKSNRDVRHSAPWNTALYLDLNVDLIRRDLPAAAAAHKDVLPRQGFFKTPEFYYSLAQKIESHGFDTELTARIEETKTPAATSSASS